MKRTTVKIPDELDARLRFEAERCGITISEVTREALEAHLTPGAQDEGTGSAFEAMIGSFRSGHGSLARRVEEILQSEAEEFRS